MGSRDPRLDAYIAKSADFARPILRHQRRVVHAGWPDVEETLKWRMPAFMYQGPLAGMAAFNQHCTFGFWKQALLEGDGTGTRELTVPAYFMNALRKDKKALETFKGFSDSHQKEYVEWVVEARTDETRTRRLETAVDWMAEGKARNWKYERK